MDQLELTTDKRFDVIVIGSGAGGAAATYRLVHAGLEVLLIEKGKPLPRDGSTLDVAAVIHEGRFKSTEPWCDRDGKRFTPEEYFNVGGKTKWYGAALARFGAREFTADADHDCLAWPLSHDELAAYYDEVERLLGVQRFDCEPDLARIVERLVARDAAWRAEPLPLGLDARILEHAHEARHFDGFASVVGFKADAELRLLGDVATAPNLTVLTGRRVTALESTTERAQRVAGVRLDDGRRLAAREIVLAAGALHSPRLLQRFLRAAGLEHLPMADSVGRNFKLHLLTAVLAISPGRKTDLLRKTTLLLHDALPHSSVQALGFDAELIGTLIPAYVPRPLARFIGERAYGFFLQTEDGSSRANRVLESESGPPVLDYDARRTPAARAEHRRLVKTFCRDLRRAGYLALAQGIGLHGTAHACGTLVTGSDPRLSVVDATGRVHGLEGLSVADGSILPRSSRVNPALTIYAFGLRVADRIAAELRGNSPRSVAAAGHAVAV